MRASAGIVKSPGNDADVDSRLINYENRPGKDREVGGIKFWVCKNGPDRLGVGGKLLPYF